MAILTSNLESFGQEIDSSTLSEISEINELTDEVRQIKEEIKKSNQNDETIFWMAFFMGEILAGIAIIATIFYVRELKDQNETIRDSFEATRVKNMVDSIHEVDNEFSSLKIKDIHQAVSLRQPIIIQQEGKFEEQDLIDYLSIIGKIYLLHELNVVSTEYIDKMYGTKILKIKHSPYVQKYIEGAQKIQGEQTWKQIEFLTNIIEKWRREINPDDPTLKNPINPNVNTNKPLQKLNRTYPKGYEPKS